MQEPPGVPRWWAKRSTGVLLALLWGGAAFALAFYAWHWSTEGALDLALYNGLGIFALWLMKPFTVWLLDGIRNGVSALRRLRTPRLPRINWKRGQQDNNVIDEEKELLKLTPREFEELCAVIARSWGYALTCRCGKTGNLLSGSASGTLARCRLAMSAIFTVPCCTLARNGVTSLRPPGSAVVPTSL
jgi:hypothetical protein